MATSIVLNENGLRALPVSEVYRILETRIEGLNGSEAEARLKLYGRNAQKTQKKNLSSPDDWSKVAHEANRSLESDHSGSPTLLIVTYDAGKRAPGLVSVSAREKIFLGQIPLILSDVHSVKLGGVAGLYLDLLSHFSAGEDPVAWNEQKIALKLHPSTLYRLGRPSIISQWA